VVAAACLLWHAQPEIQMRRNRKAHGTDFWRFPEGRTPVEVLVLSNELRSISGIRSAIQGAAGKVTTVSSLKEALDLLGEEYFDAVIVDRHLGGWLSSQVCKSLAAIARPTPVVGLINEECVLDLSDGIEAGLKGVYYKDQIDPHLMRRLAHLALLPRVGSSPNEPIGA
jgi:DNA-binding NarL/FixJ family response regulator